MARKKDTDIFLDKVRDHSGRIGNKSLRDLLGWPEEKYWKIHETLLLEGRIEKGRGQGGSVILIDMDNPFAAADVAANASADTSIPERIPEESVVPEVLDTREIDLYGPIQKSLSDRWATTHRLDEFHCEITAMKGRRDTGGSWSRPDISAISLKKYEYLRDITLDIVTFEIKAAYDVSVKGVLEALSHRDSATKSYVIYHTAGRDFSDFPESVRIEEIAVKHGIGVFSAKKVEDFDSWEEVAAASRVVLDPDKADMFIRRIFSSDAQSKIRKWV